ncbi:hypothetical protein Tco_0510519 [Tanacetum coccineum]
MRKRDRKRNFRTREKENARREKKFKGLVNVRSERREIPHSQKGINTVGMVRGKGYRKRPYEKIKQWMDSEISFPSVPRYRLVDSPIILEAYIEGFQVQRIYVDGGSSSEVMYEHCFRNLGPDTRAKLRESRVPLLRFSGKVNYPLGIIDLSVTMEELDRVRTVLMEFAVVKCHSPNNVILGRSGMRNLGARLSENVEGLKRHKDPPQKEGSHILESEQAGSEGKDEPIGAPEENRPPDKVIVNDDLMTSNNVYFIASFIPLITEYLVNISKRRAFWSLNKDILKITVLTTNTPYPSRKIRRICACTHQRPQRKHDQYAVSREDQYAVLEI